MKLFVVVTGDEAEGSLWLACAPRYCAVSGSVPVTVGTPGATRSEVALAVADGMAAMRRKCVFTTINDVEVLLG